MIFKILVLDFYTYISTLGMAMEVAAKKNIPLMVLDRPNPPGGLKVEGAILDTNYKSFVGYYPIPTRYGMTVGELSFMAKSKKWLDCKNLDLIIVKMDNWNRKMYFDDTKAKMDPAIAQYTRFKNSYYISWNVSF